MKTIHLDENKNPFLPNRQMVRFCRKNVMTISSYPTIDNADIINEISSVFNIEKEFVSFGNGSMDIFSKLVSYFGDVRYGQLIPTFWGFKHFTYLNNMLRFTEFEYCDDYEQNLKTLEQLAQSSDVIYLCNANNPTLDFFAKQDLLKIVSKYSQCKFIIDETLLTYEDYYNLSVYKYVKQYENLFVIISLSKIFGIAGLRAGIMFSDPTVAKEIHKVSVPFSTSILTQKFLLKFLSKFNKLDNIKMRIYKNFQYLIKMLPMNYITKIENRNSSFINIYFSDIINMHSLKNFMESQNIKIRYSFELVNSKNNFIRISAGRRADYYILNMNLKKFIRRNHDNIIDKI